MPPSAQAENHDVIDDLMRRAVGYHQLGRFAQAVEAYQAVLDHDPQQGDAYRLLGGLYLQHEQPEKALDMLKLAEPLRPDQHEIPNNMGIALRNLGRIDEGIDCFERALRLKPDYAEAFNNLGHALYSRGWPGAAVPLFDAALTLKPDYVKAHCNRATALRDSNRAAMACQRIEQALKAMPHDPDLLHEYGVTLQVLNKLPEAIISFEQALKYRPDYFSALSNLGSALRDLGRTGAALQRYEQALKMAGNRPEIYVNLGAIFWDMAQLDRAVSCYEKALELMPDNLDALVNLGTVYAALGQPDQARVQYEQALKIKPDSVSAHSNLAALRHEAGDLDGALNQYDKALRINSSHPEARFGRGMILLAYGQYSEGWMSYEAGLGKRLMRGLSPFSGKPWTGTPLPNKTLLIWAEQGLGDTLQFVRYAALCRPKVGKLMAMCPAPLTRLLKAIPAIDEVHTTAKAGTFDEQISMMSLPYVFGTTLETIPDKIPYLHVPADAALKWQDYFKGVTGRKIGLVWAGSAREGQVNANRIDRRRSLNLGQLKPLLDVKGVQFVNLQMGPSRDQIAELGLAGQFMDPMGDVGDFADTAALVQQLDLVIAVDTSIVHLAGGLGKPVWVLSRCDACWRWLRNRPDSPWYPSARIFGQTTPGAWDEVLRQVTENLTAFAA